MPKAILITDTNKTLIEKQFDIGERFPLTGMTGLYFVADFGSMTNNYGALNAVALDKSFSRTGVVLHNDWFEVVRK